MPAKNKNRKRTLPGDKPTLKREQDVAKEIRKVLAPVK